MTRHMKIERLSTNRLNGTLNVPLEIHVPYVKSALTLLSRRLTAHMKEAQTATGPTITVNLRGSRHPRPASNSAPAAGNSSTRSVIDWDEVRVLTPSSH